MFYACYTEKSMMYWPSRAQWVPGAITSRVTFKSLVLVWMLGTLGVMTAEVFVVGVSNRALGGTKGDSFAPVVYPQSWYLT